MKNILISIDFDDATRVLNYGKTLIQQLKAKAYILHVAAPDPAFVGYEVGPQYIRDDRAHKLVDEHDRLHEYAEDFRMAGIETKAFLASGMTAETILEKAKKFEVDLIIMGNHGHGLLHEALLSSTSHEILKADSYPVLLVPKEKK